jgi:hypothetical protein
MKVFARFALSMAALVFAAVNAQAQRTTTHSDETSNNTTGCATPTSSYVGTTSCQTNFPGANDDSSAGADGNAGANTVVFDVAPKNLADFSHDNVDIHKLVYNGFGVTDSGKVFANIVLWHAGPPFNYTPKSPGPENTKNGHFVVGYANDDANSAQVTAQLAFMKRLKIDGIVGNPPGPLPLNLPSQDSDPNNPKNRNVNEAMSKWKMAADNDSSGFLYSIMTDQVMWKQNTICTAAGITPSCVEKVMTCSLDFMNTAATSTFTCVLDSSVYNGGGFFADTHYWKVNGRPVMSYFLDESSVFTQCTGTAPCAVYNDNQPGTTCTSSSDCWQKIYGGLAHHINSFSAVPIVINRDNFSHLPTSLNGGSFRWFNPTTDQNNQDLTAYDNWLTTASTTLLPVALAVGLGKVDHAQSPFPSELGDHILMDAKCGKTFLTYMSEPSKFFGPGHPRTLQALEIATWDDYDEGTEMETGIDNCVSSFSSSLVGNNLSWTIAFNAPGDESTIDHYAIFYSTDGSTGESLTELADVAPNFTGNYSFTLPTTLPSTTVIYVKAVGKPMLQNHMTTGVVCTTCGGNTVTVRPTITTPFGVGYTNAANAEDGNLSTFASGVGGGNFSEEVWSGFGSVSGTPTQINLKISSAANCVDASTDGLELNYSLDGGSTWNLVYIMGFYGGPCVNRSQQTDIISLPLTQNLSQVQVFGAFYSTGSASHQVFDAWIEVTR